jgi:hypothetical protein
VSPPVAALLLVCLLSAACAPATDGPPVTPAAGTAVEGGADCAAGEQPVALPAPPPPPAAPPGHSGVNQVTVQVHADCRAVRVGQPVHLRFTASGSLRQPGISGLQVDGETTEEGPSCAVPQADEQPLPGVEVRDVEHVYRAAGHDVVVVRATTFCSRFSGSGQAELTIEVMP